MEEIKTTTEESQANRENSTASEKPLNKCKICKICGQPFQKDRYGNELHMRFYPIYRNFGADRDLYSSHSSRLNITDEDDRCVCVCDRKDCVKTVKKEHRKENIDKYMIFFGIPPKFVSLKTDKNVSEYLTSTKGVFVWGKPGTGKTVMVCSIGRELCLNLQNFYFISHPKFIMELQSDYENAFSKLEKIVELDNLIIDDFGAEKMTSFVQQAIYFLINEREQHEKKTIITSNFSLSQIDKQIDGRVSSRIAGMCNVLELKGNDRRIGENKK